MRKRPIQAITFDQRHRIGPPGPSRPPFPHEKITDRLFTAFAHMTGLTRHARMLLVKQLEQVQGGERLQYLHRLLNIVVDGGWAGLWTSLRVSVGAV